MMDQHQDVPPAKQNDDCCFGKSTINYADLEARMCERLPHTWQFQNQTSSGTNNPLHSYQCDCDELDVVEPSTCFLKASSSMRAVAEMCFGTNGYSYKYEIIDIYSSPDTGHIMHPPDPCAKHNKQNEQQNLQQQSRLTFAVKNYVK